MERERDKKVDREKRKSKESSPQPSGEREPILAKSSAQGAVSLDTIVENEVS